MQVKMNIYGLKQINTGIFFLAKMYVKVGKYSYLKVKHGKVRI
jgi:imidazoleglycerol phosphate dehydratase HisB